MQKKLSSAVILFVNTPLLFAGNGGPVASASVPALESWGLGILIGGLGVAIGIRHWRSRQRGDK